MANVTIQNSERVAAEFPTFQIPPVTDREELQPGGFAQLVFKPVPAATTGPGAERMWVRLTERTAEGRYKGLLDNDPVVVDMQVGDKVEFGPEHVIKMLSGGY